MIRLVLGRTKLAPSNDEFGGVIHGKSPRDLLVNSRVASAPSCIVDHAEQ